MHLCPPRGNVGPGTHVLGTAPSSSKHHGLRTAGLVQLLTVMGTQRSRSPQQNPIYPSARTLHWGISAILGVGTSTTRGSEATKQQDDNTRADVSFTPSYTWIRDGRSGLKRPDKDRQTTPHLERPKTVLDTILNEELSHQMSRLSGQDRMKTEWQKMRN